MKVNVYKSWTGKEFDTLEFQAGMTIKDCVSGVDWENAVILCNGNRVNENHVLKENDLVTIRPTPGGWGVLIFLAIFGIAEAISWGTTGQGLFQNLKDWLTPDIGSSSNNNSQQQQETLPTLKGARNQNIAGKPIPFIVGQTRITPYAVGTGYHSISGTDGETQRFHQLYIIGYNDIRVGMFKFGETDFAYNGMSESYQQRHDLGDGYFQITKGYKLEIGEGVEERGSVTDFNAKAPFFKANPTLTIASGASEVSGFSYKVTEEAIGQQIINANGSKLKITRASDRYPFRIEVEIAFNGLIGYNDEGKTVNASATICVGYSIDGGKTFEPFSNSFLGNDWVEVDDEDKAAGITGKLSRSTISRQKNKTMRFVASQTFSYDYFRDIEEHGNGYVWIRVEREDPDSTDTKTNNKAYIAYIRTWVYDKERSEAANDRVPQAPVSERLRDKTFRCGLAIDATENVSDELDELNCMAVAKCRTWDSGKWSDEKSPTDNPAANALNLMQSAMLGEFAYPDEKIDLDEFGRLYEFCEKNGFSVGTALTSRKKLSEVLDNILIQARAYRTVAGQKYSLFIDTEIPNPVCMLNNSNILKDGAGNTKEFNPLPDGFMIKFVNKNIGYEEDDVYVMFNDNMSYDDPKAVIESLEMPFVTDPKQVAKNAWFEYGKRKLRPEIWKRTVTTEANLIEVGSRVELQDDTIQVGLGNGGWITKVYVADGMVTGFRISSRINISDLTKNYGAKITHSTENSAPDIRVRKLAVREAGYHEDFELDTPVLSDDKYAPCIGDLVSVGEYINETISAICLGKKDAGDGKFELSLVPYSASLYSIDSNSKVEFDSKVSSVQKSAVNNMFDYVSKGDMVEAVNEAVSDIVIEAYDKNPPTVPKIIKAESTEVGNVQITFSPSTDAESGVLQYAIWRRRRGTDSWYAVKTVLHDDLAGSYFYEDNPPEKFISYVYSVSASDKMNNWSEKSDSVEVLVEVTKRPPAPKGVRAEAGSGWIDVQFSHEGEIDAASYAAEWEYEISKDGGNTWNPARKGNSGYYAHFWYDFDREEDGWPEADELLKWKFRARVKSTYGLLSDWAEIWVNTLSYMGWTPKITQSSATAGQGYVTLMWDTSPYIYGTVTFKILLNREEVKELASRSFMWKFDDFKERKDFDDLKFTIIAVSESGKTDESSPEVDVSGYGTYKVEKPWIKASARKEGIDVSWNRTNDFYGKCEYVLLKDGEEILRSARETEHFLRFGEDEFPEREDIERISLQVRIEGDADSAESDPAEIDCSDYLTWIPQVPKAYPSASGRSASLSWDTQDGVYGFTGCEIQIAKGYRATDGKMSPITDAEELEWYAPALGLNPYESVENYRRGEPGGRLEVNGNSVTFSLPLFGQDEDRACDTPYAFRLRGKTSAGKVSEWTEALFVTCKAVSASDVVRAWDLDDKGERVKVDGALGAAQIFVEELSAITANLGYITDGALRGNAYNYWAVSDTPMDDGSTLWRGSFRVGGSDQYILVEPRLKDGAPTGEYDITFVVGNYSVSATGTQIRGGSFEVYDDEGNLVFGASKDGARTLVETSTRNPDEVEADLSVSLKLMPITARCGEDVFVIDCGQTIEELVEIILQYIETGDPSLLDNLRVTVYRLAGQSFEEWWTISAFQAYSFIYSNAFFSYEYIDAPDGKFISVGFQDPFPDAGILTFDIYARTASFSLPDYSKDGDATDYAQKSVCLGECVFSLYKKEENKNTYINFSLVSKKCTVVLFDEKVFATGPSGDNAYFIGMAVHGDFAYVACTIFICIFVFRVRLETGEMQLCVDVGVVKPTQLSDDALPNSLMVDDDFITMFGECFFYKNEDYDVTEFTGAVRIPQSSAEWIPFSGSINEISNLVPSPFEAYRMPAATEEYITCPAFLFDGDFAFLKTENQAANLVRLSFARYEPERAEPMAYGGTIAGSLEEAPVLEWSMKLESESDYADFYAKLYEVYSFAGLYGMAFPARLDGLDAVRMSRQAFDVTNGEIANQRWSVKTKWLETRNDSTGLAVMPVGTGFTMVSREPQTGFTRYYLASGAYLEFDKDGNLVVPNVDNLLGVSSQQIFDRARPVNSTYEQHPGMEDPNALFNSDFIASEWEKEASGGVEVGHIVAALTKKAPKNYLKCDGTVYPVSDYPLLFAALGNAYGGDGTSTFAVPDLRELVLVGAGQNGTHPIADHDVYKLGEFKDDQLQTHTHKVKEWVTDNDSLNSVKEAEKDTSRRVSRERESTYENDGRTGETTHGKQIGVNWFIKAAESTVWKRVK